MSLLDLHICDSSILLDGRVSGFKTSPSPSVNPSVEYSFSHSSEASGNWFDVELGLSRMGFSVV